MWDYLPLLIIAGLGLLGSNPPVTIAATTLLLLKLANLTILFDSIENNGISVGITILTMAVLVPIAAARFTLAQLLEILKTPTGIIALLIGIFVAWAGGRGVLFIKESPELITALITGTIIGVSLLKGLPVGPLIAGGLVYVVLTIGKFIIDYFK